MNLVSMTGDLANLLGTYRAVDLLIEAGFDGLDSSFPDDTYPTDKKFYTELCKYVEDNE